MDQQFYLIVVNLNSDKLTSSVELLTLEDYLWDLKENTLSIQIQPYTYFLNEYLKCDFNTFNNLYNETILCLNNKNELLIEKLEKHIDNTDNIYYKYLMITLKNEYSLSFNNKKKTIEWKNENLKFTFKKLIVDKEYLLDIFAAYGLFPHRVIDIHTKQSILADANWGIKDFYASNQLTYQLSAIIKYYILIMQSNQLYLHQCTRCNQLFIRKDRKKSSFCKGAYCEMYPNETPIQRYNNKLEEFDYLKYCNTIRVFFTKRVSRGIMTKEEYQEWWSEAKRRRNNITHMNYPEQPFIDWLNEQKQNAIKELKKKNEK